MIIFLSFPKIAIVGNFLWIPLAQCSSVLVCVNPQTEKTFAINSKWPFCVRHFKMHTGGRGVWYACLGSWFACLWELDMPSFIHLICFVISHVANKSHFQYSLMFAFTSYHNSIAWDILGCVFLWTWSISSGKTYRTSVSQNLKEKNLKVYFY